MVVWAWLDQKTTSKCVDNVSTNLHTAGEKRGTDFLSQGLEVGGWKSLTSTILNAYIYAYDGTYYDKAPTKRDSSTIVSLVLHERNDRAFFLSYFGTKILLLHVISHAGITPRSCS